MGRFRVGVGMEFKKASIHAKKRLVAQSELIFRYRFVLPIFLMVGSTI